MLRAAMTAVRGVSFKPIHPLSGDYAGVILLNTSQTLRVVPPSKMTLRVFGAQCLPGEHARRSRASDVHWILVCLKESRLANNIHVEKLVCSPLPGQII